METTEEINHQLVTAMLGRRPVTGRLVCAALSLAFTLVVFGPLGVAVAKGGG